MVTFLPYLFGIIKDFVLLVFEVIRRGFRDLEKYWKRRVTGSCELKRIYEKTPDFGFKRIRNLELCLESSKRPQIKAICDLLTEAIQNEEYDDYTMRRTRIQECLMYLKNEKGVSDNEDKEFLIAFGESLNTMFTYRYMVTKIGTLRATDYDPNSETHQRKLFQVWSCMFPNEPLEGIVSQQWKVLGFQNNTPVTDLRGGGFLGVECLLYLTSNHNKLAHKLLDYSHHKNFGFPLACVSIQITYWTFELVTTGLARTHFYNVFKEIVKEDDETTLTETNVILESGGTWDTYNKNWEMEVMNKFYEFHVIVLTKFVKYWLDSKPENIMAFPGIKKSFETLFVRALEDPNCLLIHSEI